MRALRRAPEASAAEQEPGRARKLGNREVFYRTDGPHEGPVIVVNHIRKTAGTALRSFVRGNLGLQPVEGDALPPGVSKRGDPAEGVAWYRDWYASLERERRERLCCVMAHTAGYLLPALDRPAETLVLVREPLSRVLSYHYDFDHRRPRADEEPIAALEQTFARAGEHSTRSAKVWEYFNGQSRHLLSIFHDTSTLAFTAGPPPDADLWRGRVRDLVDDVLLVGVQDRFADYVDELAARYGWQSFVPKGKVNPRRLPSSDVPAELRETVLAYNWLDAELYELARRAQERRSTPAPGPAPAG